MNQAINLEEQLTSRKVTLERLSNDNAEKDAKIKHQDKQIFNLTKKLRNDHLKLPTRAHKAKSMTRSQPIVKTLMKNPNQGRIHPCIYYQLSKFKAW